MSPGRCSLLELVGDVCHVNALCPITWVTVAFWGRL